MLKINKNYLFSLAFIITSTLVAGPFNWWGRRTAEEAVTFSISNVSPAVRYEKKQNAFRNKTGTYDLVFKMELRESPVGSGRMGWFPVEVMLIQTSPEHIVVSAPCYSPEDLNAKTSHSQVGEFKRLAAIKYEESFRSLGLKWPRFLISNTFIILVKNHEHMQDIFEKANRESESLSEYEYFRNHLSALKKAKADLEAREKQGIKTAP